VTAPPDKPLDQMTQEEVREWKDWLMAEGWKPRPFAWGRELHAKQGDTGSVPFSESVYDYEPTLNKVVERSPDGKRYIVGVRNAELQRVQEVADEEKSDVLPDLHGLSSR
jgi:hypothetical protein